MSGELPRSTMPVDKKGSEHLLQLRRRLRRHQGEFWSFLGITQSGGGPCESCGRRVPRPVAKLVVLTYDNKPLQTLKRLRRER